MIRLIPLLALLSAPATAQANCLCLKCLTGAYDVFRAPAGSMKPSVMPGQCFITRTAFEPSDLTPGTIITFHHPERDEQWFKRIVATAGQTVQMSAGHLLIDDQPVPVVQGDDFIEPYSPQGPNRRLPLCANGRPAKGADCVKSQFTETLGGQSYSILNIGNTSLDDTPPVTVPDDHLFVLGDHRDNSIDSRRDRDAFGLGFVPVASVTGILDEILP